jgi:hypothetical protein
LSGAVYNPVAASTTTEVCAPFWTTAPLPLIKEQQDQEQDDEIDALYQLSALTAGMISANETDENKIKNAVTLACFLIILNVDKIKEWWKLGKTLSIISTPNTEIRDNTTINQPQYSNNSKYTFQKTTSTLIGSSFGFQNQWCFTRGNHSIEAQAITETESQEVTQVIAQLNVSMFKDLYGSDEV